LSDLNKETTYLLIYLLTIGAADSVGALGVP